MSSATRRTTVVLALSVLIGVFITLPAVASQGEIVRASIGNGGVQANGATANAAISSDGRYVVFLSKASNLVGGDTNARDDIFRFDRTTGQVVAVSVTSTGAFLEATHSSPQISGDGRFVAFWSDGPFDAGDDARTADVIVKDLLTGSAERVSVASDGTKKEDVDRVGARATLAMSDDGRFVAFNSSATNLVAGDVADGVPDLYLRDRVLGTTILLSAEEAGGPGTSSGEEVVISGAGAAAVAGFKIEAAEGGGRLIIRLLDSGNESLVEGADAQRGTILAVAAGGGKAIISDQSGEPEEYDVASKTLTELPANVDWQQATSSSFSSDLRYYVVLESAANGFQVFDREEDELEDLPRSLSGARPDQVLTAPSISDDGMFVGFATAAANLTSGDTNGVSDAFYLRIGEGIFSDDDGNPFAADIEWLYGEGITLGCAFDLFCPKAPVTREQMASFLVRALDLPVATSDAFTDDAGSPHEADINALAAAGVTQGCGEGLFCPKDPVSRQEMASFLVRALELPEANVDYFTDDQGSVHEDDNNALALAQVTLGCAPQLFCPTGNVLREQMAAFLHRALG
jgi:hypothetical protein